MGAPPALTGMANLPCGPWDQLPVNKYRTDVLVFTSEKLQTELAITGLERTPNWMMTAQFLWSERLLNMGSCWARSRRLGALPDGCGRGASSADDQRIKLGSPSCNTFVFVSTLSVPSYLPFPKVGQRIQNMARRAAIFARSVGHSISPAFHCALVCKYVPHPRLAALLRRIPCHSPGCAMSQGDECCPARERWLLQTRRAVSRSTRRVPPPPRDQHREVKPRSVPIRQILPLLRLALARFPLCTRLGNNHLPHKPNRM